MRLLTPTLSSIGNGGEGEKSKGTTTRTSPALRVCPALAIVGNVQRDTVTVERFYTNQAQELELKLMAGAKGLKRVIREPTVNRPGLVLSGFTRYFANKRVQVIGNAEAYF